MKSLRMIFISMKEPMRVILRIGAFFATAIGIFFILKLLIFLIPGELSGDVKAFNGLMLISSFFLAIPGICWVMNIRRALKIADEKKITLEKAWEMVKIENIRDNLY